MAIVWAGRSVLVTGAGGFVGGHVAARLASEGAEVVALLLDRKPITALDLLCDGPVTRVYCDLCDSRAARTHHPDLRHRLRLPPRAPRPCRRRSPGTVPTLEGQHPRHLAPVGGLPRPPARSNAIAVASSDKAYGPQRQLPYTEVGVLHGLGPYDARRSAPTFDPDVRHPLGWPRRSRGVQHLRAGRPAPLPAVTRALPRRDRRPRARRSRSDGSPTRDYLYIDDAVSAYLALADQTPRDDVRGRAFNFGNGVEVSVLELVQTMLRVAGVDLEPVVLGQAAGEIDRQVLDSTLARETLGWQPAVPLAEGLRRTLDWTRGFLGAGG